MNAKVKKKANSTPIKIQICTFVLENSIIQHNV